MGAEVDGPAVDPKCVTCGKNTSVIFNINFKAVAICEKCARAITVQQVNDMCGDSIE